jgi:hypothetical protein
VLAVFSPEKPPFWVLAKACALPGATLNLCCLLAEDFVTRKVDLHVEAAAPLAEWKFVLVLTNLPEFEPIMFWLPGANLSMAKPSRDWRFLS